jgi:hypothetical protein
MFDLSEHLAFGNKFPHLNFIPSGESGGVASYPQNPGDNVFRQGNTNVSDLLSNFGTKIGIPPGNQFFELFVVAVFIAFFCLVIFVVENAGSLL